jgi:K+:H+ antiporter subunit KhtT
VSVDITSRVLPGIGVCHELALHEGRHIGIVIRRTGQRDFVIYDDEGDGAAAGVTLTGDEAIAVAEVLAAPRVVFPSPVEGLVVEQLPVPDDSPFAGRPLGETHARTRTGASIVAVLREGTALPSPTPEFVLHAGDLVVIVGTRAAIDQLTRILDGSAE